MTIKKILLFPHKTLRRAAASVTEFDEDLRALGAALQETMRASSGIGLAANQIGVTKRVVAVRGPDEGDPPERDIIAVNPEILSFGEIVKSDEGCLSVPGMRGTVKRSREISLRAQDLDGEEMLLDLDDHRAIVFQHEIDHLDGILFFDRLSRLKRNTLLRRYRNASAQGG